MTIIPMAIIRIIIITTMTVILMITIIIIAIVIIIITLFARSDGVLLLHQSHVQRLGRPGREKAFERTNGYRVPAQNVRHVHTRGHMLHVTAVARAGR